MESQVCVSGRLAMALSVAKTREMGTIHRSKMDFLMQSCSRLFLSAKQFSWILDSFILFWNDLVTRPYCTAHDENFSEDIIEANQFRFRVWGVDFKNMLLLTDMIVIIDGGFLAAGSLEMVAI